MTTSIYFQGNLKNAALAIRRSRRILCLLALISVTLGPLAVAQAQCNPGYVLCGTNYCVPSGSVCCASVGRPDKYCTAGTSCTADGNCTTPNTGGGTCPAGSYQCGANYCVPNGGICCANVGHPEHYCAAGNTCTSDGGCTTTGTGGGTGGTCPAGSYQCGANYCVPNGGVCCANVGHPEHYCAAGNTCTSDGSCVTTTTSGGTCPGGTYQCGTNYCVPDGGICCASVGHPEHYCTTGGFCQADGTCGTSSGGTGGGGTSSGGTGGGGTGGTGTTCDPGSAPRLASCGGDTCGCADQCTVSDDCSSGCCSGGFCAPACVCGGGASYGSCGSTGTDTGAGTGTGGSAHGCTIGAIGMQSTSSGLGALLGAAATLGLLLRRRRTFRVITVGGSLALLLSTGCGAEPGLSTVTAQLSIDAKDVARAPLKSALLGATDARQSAAIVVPSQAAQPAASLWDLHTTHAVSSNKQLRTGRHSSAD